MPEIVAVVFARGGSKGVKGKNLRTINGLPMVASAVKMGLAAPSIDRVLISTEDEEIARVAQAAGAELAFMRPAMLAGDDTPEWLAWQHAVTAIIATGPLDLLVSLPPIAPLRSVDDVERCIAAALEPGVDIALTVTPAARSPYFNMVSIDGDGNAHLAIAGQRLHRRQDTPQLFDITPVAYAAKPGFVLANTSLFDGVVRAVTIAPERSIDVDTEFDLRVARAMSRREIPAGLTRISQGLDLSERVSIVTGGAGHIGRVICQTLAELGSSVVVLDLDEGKCGALASELESTYGVASVGMGADLLDDTVPNKIIAHVLNRLRRIDVLVNCAALVGTSDLENWGGPFEEQSRSLFRLALEANLTAAFAMAQAASPSLSASGNGSIINIGSIYGVVAPDPRLYVGTSMANPAAYAASKAGLLQLTRWLAVTLAPKVRVNAISPGGVERGQPPEFIDRYVERTPAGRMATEDDLRGVIALLAGDLSRYITGQNIMVDGGWSAW